MASTKIVPQHFGEKGTFWNTSLLFVFFFSPFLKLFTSSLIQAFFLLRWPEETSLHLNWMSELGAFWKYLGPHAITHFPLSIESILLPLTTPT